MILLKKLNDEMFALNPDLIQCIEENPDTTISLVTGNKFIVKDTMQEVINKIIDFRKKCYNDKINNADIVKQNEE